MEEVVTVVEEKEVVVVSVVKEVVVEEKEGVVVSVVKEVVVVVEVMIGGGCWW